VTGREFSEVDIDLLADYVGGALDGTPDESVVAGLVADDPAWRAAHDALTGGTAAVGAQLRLLGATPEPMPTDVAVRLDAALAGLAPLTGPVDPGVASDAVTAAQPSGTRDAVPGRHLVAVPGAVGSGGDRSATPGRRRALRRWAAPVGVAAGVLVFAGIGLGELLSGGESADTTSSYGGQAAPMMESQESGSAAVAVERVTASGTDYRRDNFQAAGTAPFSRGAAQGADEERHSEQARVLDTGSVVPALQRLSVREALIACIDAIAAEHGAGPVDVESADFARFEGSPALVVRFTASDGTWAWASGPDCGARGAAADTRHQVKVS
jgi:hypothetical protein